MTDMLSGATVRAADRRPVRTDALRARASRQVQRAMRRSTLFAGAWMAQIRAITHFRMSGATMRRVGLIVPSDFQLLSLAPLAAFELVNLPSAQSGYEIQLLSEHGGTVRS